jgi:hypothetical protein
MNRGATGCGQWRRAWKPALSCASVRAAGDVAAKVLPLPAWARERIARNLTRAFLRDVNDFMFNEVRR